MIELYVPDFRNNMSEGTLQNSSVNITEGVCNTRRHTQKYDFLCKCFYTHSIHYD